MRKYLSVSFNYTLDLVKIRILAWAIYGEAMMDFALSMKMRQIDFRSKTKGGDKFVSIII